MGGAVPDVVHRVAEFRSPVFEAVAVPTGLRDEHPLAAGLSALPSLGQLRRCRPLEIGEGTSRAGVAPIGLLKRRALVAP